MQKWCQSSPDGGIRGSGQAPIINEADSTSSMGNPSHRTIQQKPWPESPVPTQLSCLGRTCLKWQANGELTDLDLQLVLERLAQADQAGTALTG